MELNGLMKRLYQAGEWGAKLAYANILWMGFTLLGLGIFGFMPATVGLFTLLRQWILGTESEPAIKTMWRIFRKEILKSNGYGLIFVGIGLILKMDILYFGSSSEIWAKVLLIVMICLSFVYFITVVNFFPAYVHFDIPYFQYFKYALVIGITQLSSTLVMGLGAVLIFCLYWYVSGLVPLFCVSLLSLNFMWFGHRAFKRIEHQQRELVNQNQ